MKNRTHIFISMTLLAATLAGCTVGPKYKPPKVEVSPQFGEITNFANASTSITNTNAMPSQVADAAPVGEWWKAFHDAELNRIIDEALRTNYDVQIAAVRIREARYQRSIIAADLFPNVDADGGYLRARGSKNVALPLGSGGSGSGSGNGNGSQTASAAKGAATDPPTDPPADPPAQGGVGKGSGASSGSGGGAGAGAQIAANPLANPLTPFGQGGLPGVSSSLYQIGLDSTWELDVFGGTRRRLEAAAADLSAAVENMRDVSVTLVAEVAMDYLQLRGTQLRLAIARTNLASQNETLQLTQSRANAGLTSRADVIRAAAQVSITAATIPPLEIEVRRNIHALSILLAKEPTALADELSIEQPLPVMPPVVPVGLPSDLLKRRPDIRKAERQLVSLNAKVGSAKADLLPKFALTGNVGFDSTTSGNLFNWQSRYFIINPSVSWRIFDAGRIISNIALQKANKEEGILQYRSTILTAFKEVEDALVSYAEEQQHHAALAQGLAQTEESLQIVRQQYEHGLSTFLEVLDAQRNVLSLQDQLAQSEQTVTTNLVALYKALGGGWEVHIEQAAK